MWADMTTTIVTTASHDDIDALVASVAGLFVEDGARHDSLMDVGWPAREGAAYYSALIGDQTCLVTLARQDSQVIGHLIGRLSEPGALRTGRIAVLESMRVTPAARGTGVGSLLVENFLAWGRDHDAAQASVTAFAANRTAQRFYERHGFVAKSVTSRAIL